MAFWTKTDISSGVNWAGLGIFLEDVDGSETR